MVAGRIPYAGFETWYREEGKTDAGKLPVLCLLGGPGAAHDYIDGCSHMAHVEDTALPALLDGFFSRVESAG